LAGHCDSTTGRTNGLIVIIPAHFLGGVLGVTALKLVLERLGLKDMLTLVVPIFYQYDGVAFGWQVMYLSTPSKCTIAHLNEMGLLLLPSLPSLGNQMFIKEIIITMIYVAGYLVIPEMAKINGIPIWAAWLVLMPLLFVKVPDQGK